MVEIKTVEDMIPFLSEIIRVYETLDGKWERFSSSSEFISRLLDQVDGKNMIIAEKDDKGTLVFFVVITIKECKEEAFWWLLYCDPKFKRITNKAVKNLLGTLKKKKLKKVFFSSSRLTTSYKRWVMRNFDAVPYSITYQISL